MPTCDNLGLKNPCSQQFQRNTYTVYIVQYSIKERISFTMDSIFGICTYILHMKDITLELGTKIFVCVLSQKLTLVYFCKKVLELKTLKNVLIYCENMSDKPTNHWQGFFSLFIMYTSATFCWLLLGNTEK